MASSRTSRLTFDQTAQSLFTVAEVIIYTTAWCGYCRAAKRLLDSKGIDYQDIDVDGDQEKRAWLREVTGRHTVPQIFIEGKPYGGYDDINALDPRGELDPLLGLTS